VLKRHYLCPFSVLLRNACSNGTVLAVDIRLCYVFIMVLFCYISQQTVLF